MNSPSRALQIMVRNPVAGRVKTRLVADVGTDAAYAVYCGLLDHSLDVGSQIDSCRVTVFVDSPPLVDSLRLALSDRGLAHAFQGPGDLGQRMHQALSHGLQHSKQVVLIGSDCPDYSVSYLQAAFDCLQEHDVVLGPAMDGGYVMIGARDRCPEVFEDMPWSTPALLEATRARLRQSGLTHAETTTLRDIDTAADLVHFPSYHKAVKAIQST